MSAPHRTARNLSEPAPRSYPLGVRITRRPLRSRGRVASANPHDLVPRRHQSRDGRDERLQRSVRGKGGEPSARNCDVLGVSSHVHNLSAT